MTAVALTFTSAITHKELFDAVQYEHDSAQQSEAKFIAYFTADPERFENAVDFTYNHMRKAFLKAILDGMELMELVDLIDWLTGQRQALIVFHANDSLGANHWAALAYENRKKLGTYKIEFLTDMLTSLTD